MISAEVHLLSQSPHLNRSRCLAAVLVGQVMVLLHFSLVYGVTMDKAAAATHRALGLDTTGPAGPDHIVRTTFWS